MLSVTDLHRPGLGPLSFVVEAGECLVVRGASGAGKSLLLRAIADLDPNEGQVSLDGMRREDLPAPDWRRRVTYLAAEPGWWADLVAEHFTNWSAAERVVDALGLPADCGGWPIARLSTGEKQRLALARSLLLEPDVLLLDEPTAGLDPDSVHRVEDLIRKRLDRGVHVLWVTHDRAQALRISQRGIDIDAGRLRDVRE